MPFLGIYEHSLDDKKRITVPSKIRNQLKRVNLFVSKGFDNCLEIRSEEEFQIWVKKLNQIGDAKTNARALRRKIFANSDQLKLDNAGRIKISTYLLESIDIKKEIMIVGNGNRFEIWCKDVWKLYQKNTTDIEECVNEFNDLI